MGAMNITTLKSTTQEVILQIVADETDKSAATITWTHLAELFEHPDTVNAPSAPQMGSVTGERKMEKANLCCNYVAWTNSEGQANGPEHAITWVNGNLLYGTPDDAGSHTFSSGGLCNDASSIHATDVVIVGAPSVAPGTSEEYSRLELSFGTKNSCS